MHTVEKKPDMKPWIFGPIPLLNHSALDRVAFEADDISERCSNQYKHARFNSQMREWRKGDYKRN